MLNDTLATLAVNYDHLNGQIYENADLRTRDMLFMRGLGGVIAMTFSYLAFTVVGPRIMADRKPFDLKWTMFVYNVVMSLFSLWMCLEMSINSWRSNYTYLCDPYRLSYEPAELRLVNVLWWYFLSKPIEFLDTVFMVLKKKNSQITVLHVYHHSFMFPFLFMSVLMGPCGQALPAPIINSFVHFIMYGYYALSLFPVLQPFLWWKKYITQMQLLQFVVIVASSVYGICVACEYPKTLLYTQLGFIISLIVLFGNFYVQSYVKRKHHPIAKKEQTKSQ